MRGEQSDGRTRPPWEDGTDTIRDLFRAAFVLTSTWSERRDLFLKLVRGYYVPNMEVWGRSLEIKFQNLYNRDPWVIAHERIAKARERRASSDRVGRDMTEWARKPSPQPSRRENMIKRIMGEMYFEADARGPPPYRIVEFGSVSDQAAQPVPEPPRNLWTRVRIWSNRRIEARWQRPRWFNLNTRLMKWRVDRSAARIEAGLRLRSALAQDRRSSQEQ
jgi:hypothetical protein